MSGPCKFHGSYLGGGIHGFSALIHDANEQVSFFCVDFHCLNIGYMHLGGGIVVVQSVN